MYLFIKYLWNSCCVLGRLSCHKAFCLVWEREIKQIITQIGIWIMIIISAIKKKLWALLGETIIERMDLCQGVRKGSLRKWPVSWELKDKKGEGNMYHSKETACSQQRPWVRNQLNIWETKKMKWWSEVRVREECRVRDQVCRPLWDKINLWPFILRALGRAVGYSPFAPPNPL